MELTKMDKLKQQITMIVDQFAKEEIGNRLSQFSLMSLKALILKEFDSIKEDSEKKLEVVK